MNEEVKNEAGVIVNEVAWMGTENSSYDEWIELKNKSERNINLAGWRLEAADGTPEVELAGKINAGGFFILERTDETTLPEQKADLIYKGALSNKGERLTLLDGEGNPVDEVDAQAGWPEGDNESKRTMERKEDGWQTSKIKGGTPGAKNSPGMIIQSVKESEKIPVLKPRAYSRAANKRFLQTFFFGASLALLCTGLAVIIKRKVMP